MVYVILYGNMYLLCYLRYLFLVWLIGGRENYIAGLQRNVHLMASLCLSVCLVFFCATRERLNGNWILNGFP